MVFTRLQRPLLCSLRNWTKLYYSGTRLPPSFKSPALKKNIIFLKDVYGVFYFLTWKLFWSFLFLFIFLNKYILLLLPIYWLHYLMSNHTEVNRADCINRRAWLVSWSLFNLSRDFRLWININGDNDAHWIEDYFSRL